MVTTIETLKKTVLAALIIGAAACGSGTSNDQGVSFTALGTFANGEGGDAGDLPDGDIGALIPLGGFVQTRDDEDMRVILSTNVEAPGSASFLTTFLGVQNNLSTTFIRTTRVNFSYNIPGTSYAPPPRSAPLSAIVGPGSTPNVGGEPGSVGGISTLPDSITRLGAQNFAEVLIVTSAEIESMIANQSRLPEFPFTLEVSMNVDGVTGAGDFLSTNSVVYQVFVGPPPNTTVSGLGGGTTEEGDQG